MSTPPTGEHAPLLSSEPQAQASSTSSASDKVTQQGTINAECPHCNHVVFVDADKDTPAATTDAKPCGMRLRKSGAISHSNSHDSLGSHGEHHTHWVPHVTNNSQVDMVSIHEEMNEGGEEVPFFPPGSVAASTFSLTCISLGVGIFVLPSVFCNMGLVLGSIMVCLFAILSNCAVLLLLQIAERHCLGTFEEILEFAFGKPGRASVSIFLATTCCIGNAGHMQFTAEIAKDLFQWFCTGNYGKPISTEARALLIFAFGTIMMPFCFARTLNSLRYMSTATVCYVTFLCTLCSCYAVRHMIQNDGIAPDRTLVNFKATVLLDSCPVIAFAYSGIINFFHVYREIKDKTQIRKCLHISTGLCCAFYLGVALIGSLAFKMPSEDYLYSFPPGNKVITCACVGLMIVIILLYPVINFPLVAAVDAVLYPNEPTSFKRRRIYSIIVLGLVITLDISVPNITMIFALAGSLGYGMLSYALPCAAYLRLSRESYTELGASITPKRDIPRTILAVMIMLLGLTMAIGSTTRIIYKASTQ